MEGREGQAIEFRVVVDDADRDALTLWADNLPPGASFDAVSGTFTWTPDFDRAGTYPDVRIYATDGKAVSYTSIRCWWPRATGCPSWSSRPTASVREGDKLRIQLVGRGDDSAELRYSSERAALRRDAAPGQRPVRVDAAVHAERATYEIPLTVDDGQSATPPSIKVTVDNANGAPQFDPLRRLAGLRGPAASCIKAYAFDPDNPYYEPGYRDAAGRSWSKRATTRAP